ncbi:MAG: glutathione S-transferase N-terminal domain-containing protein [Candidatus Accumulibacter sp.]|jgi:glutathione S-transferase|nr:glutathione S-transferase N-terminal domain-containing protein [Accumulibacter sp.]
MKLIGSLTSPFVRKVRVVLAEKKIECEFEIDSPWTPESNVPNVNPLGKIPVLALDDDIALFDSRVISEYLDNVAPNNKLMPAPNRERTEVKRWEALADGVCEAASTVFLERKRPKMKQSAEWIARQQDKVARGVEYMADQLGDRPWCVGTHFTLADICAGCALGYLDFRFPEIDWRKQYPGLDHLYGKLMQRPAFAETAPREP